MAFWNKKQTRSNEQRVTVKLTAPPEYVEQLAGLVSAISGVDYMVVNETEIVIETDQQRIDDWLGKAKRFGRFA